MNYALFSVLTRFSEGRTGLVEAMTASYLDDELKIPSCILPGPGSVGQDTPLFKGRSIPARVEARDSGPAISGANLRPFASGLRADLFLTVCAGERGRPCIALVPGNAQGVERSGGVKTTGLNALENAGITFRNTPIPRENLIEDPGAIPALFTLLNLFLGGVSLGAGMNFFEILGDWSDNRVIRGSGPLKENPLCASVLADVAEEIACSRLLLHDLARLVSPAGRAWSLDTEGLYTYAVMIGARIQQGIMRSINRGMELMGSAGYAKEWHAEKHWRDVKTIQSLLCGVGAEAPVKMDTARFFYDCSKI
jgi:alkylation response protein AidB-like acyl-CoA dehydrogenase